MRLAYGQQKEDYTMAADHLHNPSRQTHTSATIRVSPATCARLQSMLGSHTDTIDDLLTRMLDTAAQRPMVSARPSVQPVTMMDDGVLQFHGGAPVNLNHTIFRSAVFGRSEIVTQGFQNPDAQRQGHVPTWNGLHAFAVSKARESHHINSCEFQAMMRYSRFTTIQDHGLPGFIWYDKLNLALRQTDAKGCWRGAQAIAEGLGVKLVINFEWRAKLGAAYPGCQGRLIAGG
jgi:hypothetical protein